MPFVVYRSGAEIFRGLLSSLSDRKPCKTKIIAFIGRSCKLLAECRLIAYPSQACSVSRPIRLKSRQKGVLASWELMQGTSAQEMSGVFDQSAGTNTGG